MESATLNKAHEHARNAATATYGNSIAVALQSDVTGMQIFTWENNTWRQNTEPLQQAAPGQAPGQPLVPVLNLQPTGLQVSLQVKGIAAAMNKAFLLGGL